MNKHPKYFFRGVFLAKRFVLHKWNLLSLTPGWTDSGRNKEWWWIRTFTKKHTPAARIVALALLIWFLEKWNVTECNMITINVYSYVELHNVNIIHFISFKRKFWQKYFFINHGYISLQIVMGKFKSKLIGILPMIFKVLLIGFIFWG